MVSYPWISTNSSEEGETLFEERLQDPESLFKGNEFYRVLDIIINQVRLRFLGMNEIVSNFSVLQPAT